MHSIRRISVAALLLVGCAPSADKDTAVDTVHTGLAASLLGMNYLLDSADGFSPVDGSTPSLGFDDDSGGKLAFSVGAGCNHLGGSFTLEDDHMRVTQMHMTEMGCEMDLMEQDDWLVSFFSGGPHLALTGDVLEVTGADATLLFVDREIADPDRSLAGQAWIIDSFIEGDSVSAVNLETDPTISFSDAGAVEVTTGCNDGWGTYAVDGDTLTFSSMAFTEMDCLDEMAAAVENHVASVVMDGAVTHTIDAARLTIERGSIGLSAWTD